MWTTRAFCAPYQNEWQLSPSTTLPSRETTRINELIRLVLATVLRAVSTVMVAWRVSRPGISLVICRSFIHLIICLTTGPKPLPKPALHIVRSRASSFKWEYPLLSLRSSSSFLRLLPRHPVISIQWRTQEFCSGGVQQIQLRTEDRENGDLPQCYVLIIQGVPGGMCQTSGGCSLC